MTAAQRLTERIGGKWRGGYGEARCVVHDDHDPSMTIRDGVESVLVTCHAGCERADIVRVLMRQGHWPDATAEPETTSPHRPQFTDAEQREYRAGIWRSARPVAGTPAENYLRERGLRPPFPPSLRFGVLKHSPTGLSLPTLVAAVQSPDRLIMGLHRTFLRLDGAGKAAVSKPRMMLGPYMTGAIRLARAEAEMAVGEGIETALSYMQMTGIPTWAAICAGGLRVAVLPPLPVAATVHILVDLDVAGEEAAQVAAARLSREGRAVKLCRPYQGKDFNDGLRGGFHV